MYVRSSKQIYRNRLEDYVPMYLHVRACVRACVRVCVCVCEDEEFEFISSTLYKPVKECCIIHYIIWCTDITHIGCGLHLAVIKMYLLFQCH